jgi:hypothetical protein
MSVAEAVVSGIFHLAELVCGVLLWLWLFPPLMRQITKRMGSRWGEPDGTLPTFSPKRLWCKHRVAWYGPGTYGHWATWCDACGRKLGGR